MSEPKIIYLGPACEADTSDGRTWAEDGPWPDCDCGHRPVQYVLGETFDRVTAERDALQRRLNTADQRIDLLERLAREFADIANGGFLDDDHVRRVRSDLSSALKQAETERDQGIPGTSFQRLNMLANQGE